MTGERPLDGVTVLDFSRQMAGPYAGVVLADFGADVVKVETLPDGDPSRRTGVGKVGDESAFYLAWNRGKRGVAVDLRRPEGLAVARRLAAGADVVLENYRPGVADDIGIGYDDLGADNEGLVYCSVSGFGPRGPLASYPATDPLVQGMSGVMTLTGEPDRGPALVGIPIADFIGASLAVQGILLALVQRAKTGRGQKVDTSLLLGLMSALQPRLARYWADGSVPERSGSAHTEVVPYQAFRTADGYAMAGIWGDGDWPRFCAALERPDLASDSRFSTARGRLDARGELAAILEAVFVARTTRDWETRFLEAGALFGPVLTLPEALDHPHVKESGVLQHVAHPTLGEIPQFGSPVLLAESPARLDRPPPLLGQHTEEVLREHGFAGEEIDALLASGAASAGRSRGEASR